MKSLQATALRHTHLDRPIMAASKAGLFRKSKYGFPLACPNMAVDHRGAKRQRVVTLPKLKFME